MSIEDTTVVRTTVQTFAGRSRFGIDQFERPQQLAELAVAGVEVIVDLRLRIGD